MDKRFFISFSILEKISDKILIIFLIFLCLILRFIMLEHTYAINNDGIGYIYMAQKLWEGDFKNMFSCGGYKLGVIYSFTIAFLNTFIKNWELSGNIASIFFSSFASIPLFKILRQFFSKTYAFFLCFIGINLPYVIKQSVDVIRDTAYWFFLLFGIFFFLKTIQNSNKTYKFFLPAGLISFLLAGINRVEGFWVAFMSLIFFILNQKNKKISLYYFLISIFVIILSIFIIWLFFPSIYEYLSIKFHINYGNNYKYYEKMLTKLYISTYRDYWNYIKLLLPYIPFFIAILYYIKTSNVLSPFLIYGIYVSFKNNFRLFFVKYFLFLFFSYFLLLLFWCYSYTYLSKRYFFPLYLISLPLIGIGIKNFIEKFHYSLIKFIILFLTIFILIVSILDAIFSPRRKDEVVYKKIAFEINKIEEKHKDPLIIAGSNKKINFYINLNRKPSICALNLIHPVQFFKKCNADYLIFSKKEKNKYKKWLETSKIKKIKEVDGWEIFKCEK